MGDTGKASLGSGVCFPCTCNPFAQGVLEFPLPPPYLPTKFVNSTGLVYEANEVWQCLKEGKKQSEITPLQESLIVAEIVENIMQQLGTVHCKK